MTLRTRKWCQCSKIVLRKDEKWIMFIILKNYGFILLKFTTLWSWLSQLNLLLFPFPTSNILLHVLKYIEGRKRNKAEAQVAGDGIDCRAVKYMGFMPTWVRAQAEKQSQCKIHIKRCAARNWLMQLGGLVKKIQNLQSKPSRRAGWNRAEAAVHRRSSFSSREDSALPLRPFDWLNQAFPITQDYHPDSKSVH